ncbi:hypothetical protein [Specibacter sp. NPDC078692]|uniref:hypothetical protein n=1 Tax=Specibacter sp. NPDC078692 TaxID=3155818 RepID=UPI00342D30F7
MKALTDAMVALLPPGLKVYRGTVPAGPEFPYVLVSANIPDTLERSQARRRLLSGARLRCTVVGLSLDAVLAIAPQVLDALDGARIDPPGWVTGSVQNIPNDQWVTEDTDVKLPLTNTHPMFAVLDFLVTGSSSPPP